MNSCGYPYCGGNAPECRRCAQSVRIDTPTSPAPWSGRTESCGYRSSGAGALNPSVPTSSVEMLAWAYGKLSRMSFSKMDDALMMDRIKLLLEHGEGVPT